MSGNKMTDTKFTDPQDIDSGCFDSRHIIEYPSDEDSGELMPRQPEDAKPRGSEESSKVPCDSETLDMDSGVVKDELCDLSESLKDVKLVDIYGTETATVPKVRSQTKLPLELLFQQDDDGDTQLHIAAVHGLEKPLSTLIRVCPNKELLNLCNDFGQTALHLAVMSENAIITRMLVLAGADIGIRDRRGETPLHKATALSDVKCIQALLMPVSQNLQRKISPVLNQKNYNGQACVHVAATLGHIESLQALLFYGADINSRENLAGWTALHIAASRGDAQLVQYLQRCSAVDARVFDYAGRTPRRLARKNRALPLFTKHEDSDSDSDSDDDMFDDETESWFENFSNQTQIVA